MDRELLRLPVLVAFVAGIVLLPVLYYVSLGPLVWALDHGRIPPSAGGAVEIYAWPSNVIAPRFPRFRDRVEQYIDLWR